METLTRERPNTPHRILWTRTRCAALEAAGVLTHRYELIEGDILDKMGQKLPHRTAVTFTLAWALEVFGRDYIQNQAEIDVSPEDNPTSEPQPDVTVLRVALGQLTDNPTPSQVALLVEVSDSTLAFDLGAKARLYARASIEEYWVLDVSGRQLYIHRAPQNGTYTDVTVQSPSASVSPLTAPSSSVLVGQLLP
ncbi:Uma2 family endonuclease [Armatimonas sp.]|uniref:Uma2 family endonuclease n=1 Tax=Armatimonas sp. TaxID=1872638 RepID=UPI00374CEDCD